MWMCLPCCSALQLKTWLTASLPSSCRPETCRRRQVYNWELLYCCSQTLEKQKGIEVLKEACAACGEAIAARKGRMIVKDEARVVRCLFWPKSIETSQ